MVNSYSARNHSPSRSHLRQCRVWIFVPRFTSKADLVAFVEIVQFREMLETRITQDASPLETFPDVYTPLIAKLVHERSALVHCNFSSLMVYEQRQNPPSIGQARALSTVAF